MASMLRGRLLTVRLLEVVPDLLRRVEIGCVAWKPFEVEPGIGIADGVDMGSVERYPKAR